MAVRFDADGEDYTSTSSPPTGNFTVTCWAKISVDRNTFTTIWASDNGTGDLIYLQTQANGTTVQVWDDASVVTGAVALTVGTWYRIAFTRNGTTSTMYTGTATGALTAATTANLSDVSATNFRIGESPFGSEWLNGCVANLKHYSAVLSQAELEHELAQYVPRRTANLERWHPFIKVETADYSGNARTLSGGASTAREDGPPIPWTQSAPASRLVMITAAAGQTVTVNQATETDTSLTVSRIKTKATGQTTETDTAQAITRNRSKVLGIATETDTAQALAHTKQRTVNISTETDSAQALTRIKTKAVGQASETDTARTITRTKQRTIGLNVETDSARAITRLGAIVGTVNTATETDTARPLTHTKQRTIGIASETDSSLSVTRSKLKVTGQATTTDTARPLTKIKTKVVGRSSETDSAQTITRRGVINTASETDSARTVTPSKLKAFGLVTETDTAQTITPVSTYNLLRAAEADTARILQRLFLITVPQVLENDMAQVLTVVGGAAIIQPRVLTLASATLGLPLTSVTTPLTLKYIGD